MTPEENRALSLALRALVRSDRLEGGLRAFLASRHVAPDTIEKTLDQLRGWRFVDDARVVDRFITQKLEQGTLGRLGIAAALVRHGLDEEQAADVVSYLDPEDEVDRAAELLRKGHRLNGGPASAARYLAGRGFDEEAIRSTIARCFGDHED